MQCDDHLTSREKKKKKTNILFVTQTGEGETNILEDGLKLYLPLPPSTYHRHFYLLSNEILLGIITCIKLEVR